jgi:hypothetical protein
MAIELDRKNKGLPECKILLTNYSVSSNPSRKNPQFGFRQGHIGKKRFLRPFEPLIEVGPSQGYN